MAVVSAVCCRNPDRISDERAFFGFIVVTGRFSFGFVFRLWIVLISFMKQLFLLQIIMPAVLEQTNPRIWMKSLIRLWCRCAAWIFGIHSYLLGDETDHNGNREQAENNDNNNNQGMFNGLGAAHHQALLPREGPIGVQPYARPSWFYARIIGSL